MLSEASLGTAIPLARAIPIDAGGAAEVWRLNVGDVDPGALDECLLDEDERRRAARRCRADDRLGFVCAHILLRQLLGRRIGVLPARIGFVRAACPRCGGPHGRPELAEASGTSGGRPGAPPVRFSLSRSGGVILVALADMPVGVDIETVPDAATVDSVAALLHPAERAEIDAAHRRDRAVVFTRLWARKEAYLKGTGVGVAVDLAAEDPLARAGSGWTMLDLPAGSAHAGALALGTGRPEAQPNPDPGLYSAASRL